MRAVLVILALGGTFTLSAAQRTGLDPTTRFVGTAGVSPETPAREAVDQPDQEFLRYAVTQGGLFLLLVGVLWSYRRDFFRQNEEKDEQIALLKDLVKEGTSAIEQNKSTTERLARALEDRRLR